MWHLELITGLVVVISSCRYLLLKIWPDFAESSEAANQQVAPCPVLTDPFEELIRELCLYGFWSIVISINFRWLNFYDS